MGKIALRLPPDHRAICVTDISISSERSINVFDPGWRLHASHQRGRRRLQQQPIGTIGVIDLDKMPAHKFVPPRAYRRHTT
jgi:hypothetical protein